MIGVVCQHLPGWTERKSLISSVRSVGVPAESRTEYLLNAGLERYR
jgi:hypothetical protein